MSLTLNHHKSPSSGNHSELKRRPSRSLPFSRWYTLPPLILACIFSAFLHHWLLSSATTQASETPGAGTENSLTSAEKQAGWRLLFDGKTRTGWRAFRESDFAASCWTVEDGVIKRLKRTGSEELHVDLISAEEFSSFQFEFDWRISLGGNSGVKYLVWEDRPADWEKAYMDYEAQELRKTGLKETEISASLNLAQWSHMAMGFELQLIDDVLNEDAKGPPNHKTGALYDLMAPLQSLAQPAGNFNHARITVRGNHIEHWINGVKVLEFERGGPQITALIRQSKFNHLEGFGLNSRGHIALQDHGDEVWFKNLKVLPNP
jgi:hypothetical protein